jgi:hypothetical protein
MARKDERSTRFRQAAAIQERANAQRSTSNAQRPNAFTVVFQIVRDNCIRLNAEFEFEKRRQAARTAKPLRAKLHSACLLSRSFWSAMRPRIAFANTDRNGRL